MSKFWKMNNWISFETGINMVSPREVFDQIIHQGLVIFIDVKVADLWSNFPLVLVKSSDISKDFWPYEYVRADRIIAMWVWVYCYIIRLNLTDNMPDNLWTNALAFPWTELVYQAKVTQSSSIAYFTWWSLQSGFDVIHARYNLIWGSLVCKCAIIQTPI